MSEQEDNSSFVKAPPPPGVKTCVRIAHALSTQRGAAAGLHLALLLHALRNTHPQSYVHQVVLMLASFGGDWAGLQGTPLRVAPAKPADACAPLNRAAVGDRVVVAERGNCQHSDKVGAYLESISMLAPVRPNNGQGSAQHCELAFLVHAFTLPCLGWGHLCSSCGVFVVADALQLRNAQAAGAIGIIVTNDVQTGYFAMGADNPSEVFNIPMGGVPLGVGRCERQCNTTCTPAALYCTAECTARACSGSPASSDRASSIVIARSTLSAAVQTGPPITHRTPLTLPSPHPQIPVGCRQFGDAYPRHHHAHSSG
jgi:hypothetical protein